ncbi:MAG: hypothetical protein ACI4WR_03555, partial [Bulleidia sp.]
MLGQNRFFISFDICTAIFCLFLLIMIFSRENLHIRKTRLFCVFVCFMLGASVSEILMVPASFFLSGESQVLQGLSHLLRLSCPYLFLLYLLELSGDLRGMSTLR